MRKYRVSKEPTNCYRCKNMKFIRDCSCEMFRDVLICSVLKREILYEGRLPYCPFNVSKQNKISS